MGKGNRKGLLGVGVLVRSETDGPSWLHEKAVLGKNMFEGIFNVKQHGGKEGGRLCEAPDSTLSTCPHKVEQLQELGSPGEITGNEKIKEPN